jgi:hypothetical protein
MIAARSIDGASTATLEWLIGHGAAPDATSRGGVTATWYAAGNGARMPDDPWRVVPDHADRLRYLLDLTRDPDESADNGRTFWQKHAARGIPYASPSCLNGDQGFKGSPRTTRHRDELDRARESRDLR